MTSESNVIRHGSSHGICCRKVILLIKEDPDASIENLILIVPVLSRLLSEEAGPGVIIVRGKSYYLQKASIEKLKKIYVAKKPTKI